MSKDGKTRLPWWIDGGDETCPFCGQAYAYEMEYRCILCDAPVCPWCHDADAPEAECPACGPWPEGEP